MKAITLTLLVLLLPHLAMAYTTIDNAAEASSLWSAGEFEVLVDVRQTDEWNAGHLPNATFVPSLHETKDTSRLDTCKDCAVAVYCHSGYRANKAAKVLDENGFTNVYNVLGIEQWTDVGVELVGDEDREPCCTCETCVNTMISGAARGGMNTMVAAILSVAAGALVFFAQ